MSKKSKFIEYVNNNLFCDVDESAIDPDVMAYWAALCGNGDSGDKPLFTDNGKLILKFLQDNQETESWRAKDIAEGLFVSSRTVSGAIRKLVTDNYVEKLGADPVIYAITEKGKNITID